ncbi:MAG: FAD:protein transferase [Deltaproteobacteria bacterium]|nr:FAD:protein transferase [Deltaproteobacteria bacterium]
MGGIFRKLQSAIRNLLLTGIVLLVFIPPLLSAQNPPLFRQSRILMGTSVEISVSQADSKTSEEAMEAAFQEVERINRLMSHYRPDSEVSQITQHAGEKEVRVSPETLEVIERALYFSRLSEGAFDITIGPVFRLWNFREGKIPDREKLRDQLKRVDYRKIRADRSRSTVYLDDPLMELDLGAIAKGYAVDRACEVLKKKGVANFLVNAGGDLKVGGEKEKGVPWTIGVQHPRLPSDFIAKLQPQDAGVATSGDYEKFFIKDGERYHHVLIPSTGMPARECQSVTILAPSAMDADALATTVFVLGPKKSFALVEKVPGVHAVIVDRRGSVLLSPNWSPGVLLPP